MVRLAGTGETRNWAASKDTATFTSSTSNVPGQELGLLVNGHRFHGDRKLTGPNHCGSAPPTVEGSLKSTGNLRDWQNSSFGGSFESLIIAVEDSASDKQLYKHQAYLAGYYSNDNLNPRLPQSLVSQENRRLVHEIGGFSDCWGRPPFDDSRKGSVFLPRPTLSTHKEEPEDDKFRREESNDWADKNTGFVSNQFVSPLQGRHKTIVDLIQVMMKDRFADYVIQKILEMCTDKQREILLQRMGKHLPALKKYTYGKHIVARVELLCTEESHISES